MKELEQLKSWSGWSDGTVRDLAKNVSCELDRLRADNARLQSSCEELERENKSFLDDNARLVGEVETLNLLVKGLEGNLKACEEEVEVRDKALEKAKVALERIHNYPVHSEPVGGAYAMQDVAYEALATINEVLKSK